MATRIITLIMLPGLLVMVFFSCRKGEDDPLMSLRTRKARLEGTWHLKSGKLVLSAKDNGQPNGEVRYNFSDKNYASDFSGNGAHFEGTSALSLEFDKEGVFKMVQQMDSIGINAKGKWDFTGAVGKEKSKESILLKLSAIDGSSLRFDTFNKSYTEFRYRVKELRKDKLVLVAEKELLDGNSTRQFYLDSEFIFGR